MASPKVDLKSVEDFWSVEACGTHFVTEFDGLRDFYDKYREYRYRTLWFIHELIPFSEAKDKDLLEIGCGNGADGVEFARHGARYTGVDLTETAVEATRNHFAILGLDGTFQTENAEQLSFPDNSFDLVYSMGVLHHTPNPDRAFAQVHRVLRPGGRAIIMLYHKNSFNYYARIMGFMRLKVFLKILRRRRHWAKDRAALERDDRTGLRGNEDQGV